MNCKFRIGDIVNQCEGGFYYIDPYAHDGSSCPTFGVLGSVYDGMKVIEIMTLNNVNWYKCIILNIGPSYVYKNWITESGLKLANEDININYEDIEKLINLFDDI